MYANGTIDLVPFDGSVINSPLANEHSLEFVERDDEDHRANDDVATRWCRTFVAHTKGAAGDGCDEYRINEVLFRPVAPVDGKSFVELAGNIPAYPNSSLLGGWLLNGVNGQTGGVTPPPPTLRLPPDASPRSNGTYVVADGFDDGPGTAVPNSPDLLEDFLNLASPDWPDGTGVVGPRGIQLLTPEASFPCTGLVDAFGWTTTAMGLTAPDLRYGCSGFEGAPYTEATVGPSAARGNLSDGADTSYNENPDTGNNTNDFCLQSPTTPGDPNIRPDCVG